MNRLNIDTRNFQHLQQFWDDLKGADQSQVMRQAFRRAVRPLVQQARTMAPSQDTAEGGGLRRSIGTQSIGRGEWGILVGAKRPQGAHAHLIEEGTTERFRRTKGDAPTGRVRALHWFRRAYEATEDTVFNNLEDSWLVSIDNMIVRINRRTRQ